MKTYCIPQFSNSWLMLIYTCHRRYSVGRQPRTCGQSLLSSGLSMLTRQRCYASFFLCFQCVCLVPQQWFSTMAAYFNHLGSFKNSNSQGTIFRYTDLIGFEVSLGIGIFLNSQDDSNVQSRLRITAIGSPSGSTSPGSTTPVFQGSWLHGVWRGSRCLQSFTYLWFSVLPVSMPQLVPLSLQFLNLYGWYFCIAFIFFNSKLKNILEQTKQRFRSMKWKALLSFNHSDSFSRVNK